MYRRVVCKKIRAPTGLKQANFVMGLGLSCDYSGNQLTTCLSKSELSVVGTLAPDYTRHAGYLSLRGKKAYSKFV